MYIITNTYQTCYVWYSHFSILNSWHQIYNVIIRSNMASYVKFTSHSVKRTSVPSKSSTVGQDKSKRWPYLYIQLSAYLLWWRRRRVPLLIGKYIIFYSKNLQTYGTTSLKSLKNYGSAPKDKSTFVLFSIYLRY